MPIKKPSQERIESVKTKFQAVELKVLNSNREKFFKLPYGTALEAIDADLSKTAYRLWIYLSANYPFGDCDVELPSQTELGIRLGVSRQAVNIAAAEIQAAGLWDFWADKWKGRNLKGYGVSGSEGVKKNQQVSKKDDTLSKKDDTECQEKSTPCQEKSTPCQEKSTPHEPEPLQNAASSPSQTIQTYLDFKKTLSEEQRASFLNFCQEKTKNLSQQVNDLEAWLAHQNKAGQNRWEVYYEKFQNHERPKAKKSPSSALANKFEAELEKQRELALSALLNEAPTVPQPLKKAEIKVEPPQAFVIAMPESEAPQQNMGIATPENKAGDSTNAVEENDLTEIAIAHSLTSELKHLSEPQLPHLTSFAPENQTCDLPDNALGDELRESAYSPVDTGNDAGHQHSLKNISPDSSNQQQDWAIATNGNQESATPTIYESNTGSTLPSSIQQWLRGQL